MRPLHFSLDYGFQITKQADLKQSWQDTVREKAKKENKQ